MSIRSTSAIAALTATLAAGLPAAASAQRGDHDRGNVPSRIAAKVRAAQRALDRAEERVQDGESDRAVAAFTAVRRNLSSALKSAKKRIVADSTTGGASASVLARGDHRVIVGTAGLFDGADATVVAADAATLDAALDNRDEIVAAIAALSDRSAYDRALGRIADDVDSETEDITEALADDELSDDAKAALNAALTQIAATKAAVAALDTDAASAGEGVDDAAGDAPTGARGDCPPRDGGPRDGGPRDGGPRDGGPREERPAFEDAA